MVKLIKGIEGTSPTHAHAAGDVVSGVFDIARLPTHQTRSMFRVTQPAYYFGPHNTLLGNIATTLPTITATANRSYGVPLYIPVGMTLDMIRFEVVTAIAASSAIVGIFDAQASALAGTTKLVESAAVSTETTGFKDVSISYAPGGGSLVWLAIVCSHAITIRGFSPALTIIQVPAGSGNNVVAGGFQDSASFVLASPSAGLTLSHALLQVRTL